MKRILIYLALVLPVIGGVYYFIKLSSEKLSYENLHLESDLVYVNIPDVKKNSTKWSKNAIFQQMLHFEGMQELSQSSILYAKDLDLQDESNLSLIVRENGQYFFALEQEMEIPFWNSITGSGYHFEKKISGKNWFFLAKNDLLFASKEKEALKNIEQTDSTLDVNWNHLFVQCNAEKLSAKLGLKSGVVNQIIQSLKRVCFSVNFYDEKVVSSGFDNSSDSVMMKALKWQEPVAFDLKDLLLINYSNLRVLQFTDGETYLSESNLEGQAKNFDKCRLAQIHFTTSNSKQANVFLLRSEGATPFVQSFLGNQVVVSEGLRGYALHQLKDEAILAKHFASFTNEKCKYVAMFGDHAIFANDINWIKSYIVELTSGQVWANSTQQMKWVEDEFIESNYFEIIKSNTLLSGLDKTSQVGEYYLRNQKSFQTLPFFLFQKSIEKTGVFTTVSFNLTGNVEEGLVEISLQEAAEDSMASTVPGQAKIFCTFDALAMSAPKMVKNYATGQNQFVVFDTSNTLNMVKPDGSVEWKYKFEGTAVSDIYEVDVLKNNKIQYLFATTKKIYCVDRLGHSVEHFPFALPANAGITSLNVIDYDNSKTYRLAITSGKNVWFYDINGKSLDGWKPKAFSSAIVGKVEHFRNQTNDYLLVLEDNGQINLLQRNGTIISGFPVKQTSKLANAEINFIKGNSKATSSFTVLTKDGLLKRYNLEGKQLFSEKLPVSTAQSNVVTDAKSGSLNYAVCSGTSTYVFDSKLAKLFSYPSKTLKIKSFQTFNFSGVKLYAFQYKEYSEIVSSKGEVLLTNLPTNKKVIVSYSSASKKADVYYTSGNKIEIQTIEVK